MCSYVKGLRTLSWHQIQGAFGRSSFFLVIDRKHPFYDEHSCSSQGRTSRWILSSTRIYYVYNDLVHRHATVSKDAVNQHAESHALSSPPSALLLKLGILERISHTLSHSYKMSHTFLNITSPSRVLLRHKYSSSSSSARSP